MSLNEPRAEAGDRAWCAIRPNTELRTPIIKKYDTHMSMTIPDLYSKRPTTEHVKARLMRRGYPDFGVTVLASLVGRMVDIMLDVQPHGAREHRGEHAHASPSGARLSRRLRPPALWQRASGAHSWCRCGVRLASTARSGKGRHSEIAMRDRRAARASLRASPTGRRPRPCPVRRWRAAARRA